MKIVLDASAAIEVLLGRSKSESISQLLTDAKVVLAPDLFYAEISNVMWKYVKFQSLNAEKAKELLEACSEFVDEVLPAQSIHHEAFALACSYNVSVYDALYLVSARRMNAKLVSLDQQLVKTARKAKISCTALK